MQFLILGANHSCTQVNSAVRARPFRAETGWTAELHVLPRPSSCRAMRGRSKADVGTSPNPTHACRAYSAYVSCTGVTCLIWSHGHRATCRTICSPAIGASQAAPTNWHLTCACKCYQCAKQLTNDLRRSRASALLGIVGLSGR